MTQSNLIFRKAHRSSLPSPSGVRRLACAVSSTALLLGLAAHASAEEGSPLEPAVPAAVSDEETAQAEAPVASNAPAPSAPTQETSLSPQQSRALWPLTWKKSPGKRVAFGLEEGVWGTSWSQGLRITVPFASNFATHLRGIYLIDMIEEGPLTVDAGGRIDFIGRSEVLFNVMRLYGGGGVQVIAPISNTDGKEVRVGGGGHFGFEFFCSPNYSFFLEVGGQGGTASPGATVQAGMMVYPWTR